MFVYMIHVHIAKSIEVNFFASFSIQNGLKQTDSLSSLIFNLALKYAIKEVKEVLAYVDDVNLLGDSTETIKKNTETLIGASKEVGLEVNLREN
jgi:hypothetical protein